MIVNELVPNMLRYRLAYRGLIPPGTPLNLTFSVTNVCQSRCKTCNIWELYKANPEKQNQELTLDEIEKIFSSMGHIYIFNISGGEPFLRPDFNDILELACKYLTPGIIHIPTNAIAENLIYKKLESFLKFLNARYPSVKLTVKPSLDHIEEKHDDIRGVPGNFKKVMSVYKHLQGMKPLYEHLHVELGTVISKFNITDIKEIAAFITRLGMDSYRNEIAEQRSEMFNVKNDITPSAVEYEKAIDFFCEQIKENMKNRSLFQKATHAFRMEYYQQAINTLKSKRQVIPCYAGISNAHMSPYGDIWACCTLGYEHSMGNLKDFAYDFNTLWNSPQANQVRKYIKQKQCCCPLANQAYSNILLHLPSLLRVMRNMWVY